MCAAHHATLGAVAVKCVYALQSLSHPQQRYIGVAADLQQRLADHNAGKSRHTARYKPWELVVAVYFRDEARADEFEKYLKSGSGQAFANRHLW